MSYTFSDAANNHVDFSEVGSEMSAGTGDFTLLVKFTANVVAYGAVEQGTLYSRNFTALELYIYQDTVGVYCGGTINNPTPMAVVIDTAYAVGARRSGTNLELWRDGVFSAAATNSADASGSGDIRLGNRQGLTTTVNAFNGRMQDVGFWKVALTDAEMAAYYRGMPASRIKPQSLSLAAPLVREPIDKRNARTWTFGAAGPSAASHMRAYGG